MDLSGIPPDRPVLIAGPTASGKSALALRIVRVRGGLIVNADALQVYDGWRILTARPTEAEERETPHALFGHVGMDQPYSVGHWLREVTPLLAGDQRPVIVGGTGLYLSALTQGLADIPATPPEIRAEADLLPLDAMAAGVDAGTSQRIDLSNRARVQRAWEVFRATGRGLVEWQADTPPPLLPLSSCAAALVLRPEVAWLNARIASRFDIMLAQGAVEEARALLPHWHEGAPAFRALGGPELRDHLLGRLTLEDARNRAVAASRSYAKRQRTWFRSRMARWTSVPPT